MAMLITLMTVTLVKEYLTTASRSFNTHHHPAGNSVARYFDQFFRCGFPLRKNGLYLTLFYRNGDDAAVAVFRCGSLQ